MAFCQKTRSNTWNSQKTSRKKGRKIGYGWFSENYMIWSRVGEYGTRLWMSECYHGALLISHVSPAYIIGWLRLGQLSLLSMWMTFSLLPVTKRRMNTSGIKCETFGLYWTMVPFVSLSGLLLHGTDPTTQLCYLKPVLTTPRWFPYGVHMEWVDSMDSIWNSV